MANTLEQEREPGVSTSPEMLSMAEAYFQASQRRIGLLYHENTILAGQCTFLTGVYLCSINRILAGWKAFVHSSNQCLAWLKSNGRLQRNEPLRAQTGEDTVQHPQDDAPERYVEENLYWSCLKSEM